MTFQKGNRFGNRKGRPKKGDSLAECIRARWDLKSRYAAIDKIAAIANGHHDNPGAIRVLYDHDMTGLPEPN